jgi:microcompartment protein CcmK/EutM
VIATVFGAAAAASAALAAAPPVGPLPTGPTKSIRVSAGETFTVTLPKSEIAGRVWRIARSYDDDVVLQVAEGDSPKVAWVTFRSVGAGTTRVVFALTRGETARAAARTFVVTVPRAGCPDDLLPLGANAIGPAVTAALRADPARNRPQVTAAMLATSDRQRGPQARAECGARVWRRTLVVYIIDRAVLPAQSAAQRVLFVGRTPHGYRVWQRVR